MTSNPREGAFLALAAFLKSGHFLNDSLETWRQQTAPSPQDYRLAQEIAYGSCRYQKILKQLLDTLAKRSVKLKVAEKALFYTALYQLYWMRAADYAVVDESVKLAKKHFNPHVAKFLNALLRQEKVELPNPQDSFTDYFLQQLKNDYECVDEILKASNRPGTTQARIRPGSEMRDVLANDLEAVSQSKDYYIQNSTPVKLLTLLSEKTQAPKNILDLCSSPGGKLLFAHDRYPQAQLTANDISEGKLVRIKENLHKYGVEATLVTGKGEDFPLTEKFDLIILDVPCSNSGVLNKRPEARWRIEKQELELLKQTQQRLLDHAKKLLAPGGAIWYLTCSILKQENEEITGETGWTLLPDAQGNDGGYACLIR